MKSGKLVEVILFVSAIGLSLITNLFTGDSEVVTFYQSNKKAVLMAGISFLLVSIVLSFRSQSKEVKSNSGRNIPISKFLFSVLDFIQNNKNKLTRVSNFSP